MTLQQASLIMLSGFAHPHYARADYYRNERDKAGVNPTVFNSLMIDVFKQWLNKIEVEIGDNNNLGNSVLDIEYPLIFETNGLVKGHFGKERLLREILPSIKELVDEQIAKNAEDKIEMAIKLKAYEQQIVNKPMINKGGEKHPSYLFYVLLHYLAFEYGKDETARLTETNVAKYANSYNINASELLKKVREYRDSDHKPKPGAHHNTVKEFAKQLEFVIFVSDKMPEVKSEALKRMAEMKRQFPYLVK